MKNTTMVMAMACTALMMVGGQEAQAFPFHTEGALDPTTDSPYVYVSSDYSSDPLPVIGAGQTGMFSLTTYGDFGVKVDWDIDGYSVDDTYIGGYSTTTWEIPYTNMAAITGDGSFTLQIVVDKVYTSSSWDSSWGEYNEEGPNDDGKLWWNFSYDTTPVPEPATMLLMASGLLGLGVLRRKKNTQM